MTSSSFFAVIIFVVNLPLAFLITSIFGHALLAVPLLAILFLLICGFVAAGAAMT